MEFSWHIFCKPKNMFYIIKHVPEEGPGLFSTLLPQGCKTILAGSDDFPAYDDVTGVLIMGGPMGVYEKEKYPFILKELSFIRNCFERGVKIFGVCLGAQMIAEALGGKVYKGEKEEIGWYKITHTEEAHFDPVFSIFPKELSVFQWHGDTFYLPPQAIRLAYSENYTNQAFRVGRNVYGLQYHIEVTEEIIKEWFPEQWESFVDRHLDYLNTLAVEAFSRFLKI